MQNWRKRVRNLGVIGRKIEKISWYYSWEACWNRKNQRQERRFLGSKREQQRLTRFQRFFAKFEGFTKFIRGSRQLTI